MLIACRARARRVRRDRGACTAGRSASDRSGWPRINAAPVSPVSPVRPAARHVLLTSETHAAAPAVAGLHDNSGGVNELGQWSGIHRLLGPLGRNHPGQPTESVRRRA